MQVLSNSNFPPGPKKDWSYISIAPSSINLREMSCQRCTVCYKTTSSPSSRELPGIQSFILQEITRLPIIGCIDLRSVMQLEILWSKILKKLMRMWVDLCSWRSTCPMFMKLRLSKLKWQLKKKLSTIICEMSMSLTRRRKTSRLRPWPGLVWSMRRRLRMQRRSWTRERVKFKNKTSNWLRRRTWKYKKTWSSRIIRSLCSSTTSTHASTRSTRTRSTDCLLVTSTQLYWNDCLTK